MKRTTFGWAIRIQQGSEENSIGRYWIASTHAMTGYVVGVLATRREARDLLPRVLRVFPGAKVVRVTVTVST